MNTSPIDLILPWVDGSDPEWQKEKSKFDIHDEVSNTRYESWDNLQYVFRGIEKFMPWVHRVFFVTWGHVPEWMNLSCDKLRVVNHREYIPDNYLPTFNSNVIEMNYFRIHDLSENFILFNDDLFPLRPIAQEYYFQNDMPCEEAVETHFVLKEGKNQEISPWWNYSNVNNMIIINKHFNKLDVINKNYDKWFNPVYGVRMKQNLSLYEWHDFESFVYPHEATGLRKSVLKQIWQEEYNALNRASQNKFRSYTDVTHRLVSMWQICSGEFIPHKFKGKFFLIEEKNYREVVQSIKEKQYPIVCLNERYTDGFSVIRKAVTGALKEILPDKSDFEL